MFEIHHQSQQIAIAKYARERVIHANDIDVAFWRTRLHLHRALARTSTSQAAEITRLATLAEGNPALISLLMNFQGGSRGVGYPDAPLS